MKREKVVMAAIEARRTACRMMTRRMAREMERYYCFDDNFDYLAGLQAERPPLAFSEYIFSNDWREDARVMGRFKDAARKRNRAAKTQRVRRMREKGAKLALGYRKSRRTGWMLDFVVDL